MTPEIDKVVEDTQFGRGGALVKVTRVTWRIGTDGPFVEEIPTDEFSAETLKARIVAKVAQLEQLRAF